jgi:hypothetical protein
MNKEILDFQVNKTICEAVGCFVRATNRIDVKVGKKGIISLDLCDSCVKKFETETA